MTQYEETYQGIAIRLEPSVARVRHDARLEAYLQAPGNGSLALADFILARYRALFEKPLAISRDSLAIEILGHVYADRLAAMAETLRERIAPESRGPLSRLLERVRESAGVIDCGEAEVDTNRVVWDMLVPLRRLIYALADR